MSWFLSLCITGSIAAAASAGLPFTGRGILDPILLALTVFFMFGILTACFSRWSRWCPVDVFWLSSSSAVDVPYWCLLAFFLFCRWSPCVSFFWIPSSAGSDVLLRTLMLPIAQSHRMFTGLYRVWSSIVACPIGQLVMCDVAMYTENDAKSN